ncbi:Ketosamine-3-kinase [Dacryopinax primogenitus]|uniref:protein-ribulosamine 3-kinase n=1 Tax=Dacryopinax primogenitus (strain DJM 731) TaxID=1858805 RepID=M5FVI9_DACPD|nr:Ketosamine-3-kinase [Dacryopinax primogenitus]EJU01831.1 Ketosamine-3-kinase [Dacryopinax primogenitus]
MRINQTILEHLQALEPNATFSGSGSRVHSSSGKSYFCKIGTSLDTEQYAGEARALDLMHQAARGLAPQLYAYGISGGFPYFISQYLDMGSYLSDHAARRLAKRLATELHQFKDPEGRGFGFDVPTHCGATRVERGWFGTWEECFGGMMRQLLDGLARKGSGEVVKVGDQVVQRVIPAILGNLEVEPVLVHGDLWTGNAGVDQHTGEPVIFDPAAFYGHNEFELAIARMFGGFPPTFFSAYKTLYPPAEPKSEFQQRAELYETYHYLNHALIFGGGYAGQAVSRMKRLLRYVDKDEDSSSD